MVNGYRLTSLNANYKKWVLGGEHLREAYRQTFCVTWKTISKQIFVSWFVLFLFLFLLEQSLVVNWYLVRETRETKDKLLLDKLFTKSLELYTNLVSKFSPLLAVRRGRKKIGPELQGDRKKPYPWNKVTICLIDPVVLTCIQSFWLRANINDLTLGQYISSVNMTRARPLIAFAKWFFTQLLEQGFLHGKGVGVLHKLSSGIGSISGWCIIIN